MLRLFIAGLLAFAAAPRPAGAQSDGGAPPGGLGDDLQCSDDANLRNAIPWTRSCEQDVDGFSPMLLAAIANGISADDLRKELKKMCPQVKEPCEVIAGVVAECQQRIGPPNPDAACIDILNRIRAAGFPPRCSACSISDSGVVTCPTPPTRPQACQQSSSGGSGGGGPCQTPQGDAAGFGCWTKDDPIPSSTEEWVRLCVGKAKSEASGDALWNRAWQHANGEREHGPFSACPLLRNADHYLFGGDRGLVWGGPAVCVLVGAYSFSKLFVKFKTGSRPASDPSPDEVYWGCEGAAAGSNGSPPSP